MRNDGAAGRDTMVLALTWAAGSVDAIGYLALGHVFTANMTGNTVLLGLALGQEQGPAAVRSLVALAGFGAGLVIGALIAEGARGGEPWPAAVTRAIAVEAVFLAAFAAAWYLTGSDPGSAEVHALIALSALAMGIQSAAVRRLDVPGVATTYVTGTLTSMVTGLVAGPRLRARGMRLQGLALLVYGGGAMVGGLVHARWPALVTALPLVAVACVAGAASAGSAGARG